MEITVENIGDKIAYEANGIKDWRIIGIQKTLRDKFCGISIISEDYVPNTCLNMEGYDVICVGEFNVTSKRNREIVRWLRNVENWKAFGSGAPGAMAIGGPDICQFSNWWNEVCKMRDQLCAGTASHGDYYVYEKYAPGPHSGFSAESLLDWKKLFFVEETKKCQGYWLSSNSTEYDRYDRDKKEYDNCVFCCVGNSIKSRSCSFTVCGIRPVVFLPDVNDLYWHYTKRVWGLD